MSMFWCKPKFRTMAVLDLIIECTGEILDGPGMILDGPGEILHGPGMVLDGPGEILCTWTRGDI